MEKELSLNQLFSNFVKFNIRNKKLLLTFIIVGILGVIIFQKVKTPYYSTKAICTSGISTYDKQDSELASQRTAIDLVNHLQFSIDASDYNSLEEVLGLDQNIVKTIKNISAVQLYAKDKDNKSNPIKRFEIYLTVFDFNKISSIKDGLIYYFENNEYISSYYNSYQQSSLNLLKDIDREISELSKVRLDTTRRFALSSNYTVTGNVQTQNEIITLARLREDIKTQKKFLKPINFVQDFAKVGHKEDDILLWSLIGGIVSFFIGLFVSLVKEVN